MNKKFLCLLLIGMLLINCLPLQGAMAINTPQYTMKSKTVPAGDVFTMDIAITNNPGIISLRFKVVYDTEVLELQSVANSGILNGFTTPAPTITSPYTLRWADSLATTDNTAQGTVVTLTFKALRETDATSITIEHGEARKATGTKVTFANTTANVTVGCSHSNTVSTERVPPTCDQPGFTAGVYCNDCQTYISGHKTISATGKHTGGEATCMEQAVCEVCGIAYGELDADNHQYPAYFWPMYEPTCSEPGYSGDAYCECGGIMWKGEEIPTVNCDDYDQDGLCNYCNKPMSYTEVKLTVTTNLGAGDITVKVIGDEMTAYNGTVNGEVVEFDIDSIPVGTYTLRVSKENHATREYEITLGADGLNLDIKLCPIGDVTGDGNVNIKDFQRLLRHVNKTNPLTDYELACGDVTGDGTCNIKDFQRLLRHVNKTNPLF